MLAGVIATLLAAALFPLPRHERLRADISVVADGGRAETFIVQLPEDRVLLAASGVLQPAGAALVLDQGEGRVVSAEAFRVRDRAGNVIGLASRTSAARGGAGPVRGSDWVVLLPARGALFFTATEARDLGPQPGADGASRVAAGQSPAFWGEARRLSVGNGPLAGNQGEIVGGTEEFARLRGSFAETWELDGFDPDGTARGRIVLETRLLAVP
jgi:hypothetical protein